jgi:hypothetical protein
MTERPCRTILAPIFTGRFRSVGQRPVHDVLGQSQDAQDVGEVIRQRVELKPNGVRPLRVSEMRAAPKAPPIF